MLILRNLPVKGERPPCPCRALGSWTVNLACLSHAATKSAVSHLSVGLLCYHLDCRESSPKVANVSFFLLLPN